MAYAQAAMPPRPRPKPVREGRSHGQGVDASKARSGAPSSGERPWTQGQLGTAHDSGATVARAPALPATARSRRFGLTCGCGGLGLRHGGEAPCPPVLPARCVAIPRGRGAHPRKVTLHRKLIRRVPAVSTATRRKRAQGGRFPNRRRYATAYTRTRPLSHPTARRLPSADQVSTAAIAGS